MRPCSQGATDSPAWARPVQGIDHLDLPYPARRRYMGRWESCRLATIQRHALGIAQEDHLPANKAPAAWLGFQFRGIRMRPARRASPQQAGHGDAGATDAELAAAVVRSLSTTARHHPIQADGFWGHSWGHLANTDSRNHENILLRRIGSSPTSAPVHAASTSTTVRCFDRKPRACGVLRFQGNPCGGAGRHSSRSWRKRRRTR